MGDLNGGLDVLRIMVAAPDDDQVVEPAGDEELAIVLKTQIAGAHFNYLIGNFQCLHNFFLQQEKVFMFFIRIFGFAENKHFQFIKLVNS